MPDTRLIRIDGERAAMLIERFDREPAEGGFTRRHMVSARQEILEENKRSQNN
ncbi:MAG: HipA domain-containing protein [Pseudomonadota bacterium]|nr:HipA domain-containing protein [Pseudomonadota bacterium]